MINPPPNPNAVAADAEMRAYNAPGLANPAPVVYCLTWPGDQYGVCVVAGQWHRNDANEIEAWYTAGQLRDVLIAMQAAIANTTGSTK